MRISEQWLREWVDPELDSEQLAALLTMAGLEVDSVDPVAGVFDNVVVARIERCEAHPDADKLQVCQVADGSGEVLQIVCGAPNARPGLVAPLAKVGARLPGGMKIRRAKLRGVESQGMLCSSRELGLGEEHDGLLALPEDTPLGADTRAALRLDDVAIEIDLTPNRADCLGLIGIAQDVAAVTGAALATPEVPEARVQTDQTLPIELLDPADCARYVGRVISNIDPTAQSPFWLQERLRRCGLRSISPVVDATNYVMLELGQPMHAFDLDRLNGGIRVRRAQAGEQITLLDESEVTLSDQLLICDHQGPVAIGGIMGGLNSAVTEQTTNLFLESAWFRPQTIAGRAREMGMHTDASHRFERGVDPQLQRVALERVTQLLLEMVGGKPGPLIEARSDEHLPAPVAVPLRAARVEQVLGVVLSRAEIEGILGGLGMQVSTTEQGWQVVAPSRRMDIREEVDLIEEVARVYGYNRLPERAPQGQLPAPAMPEALVATDRLRSVLIERGYFEVVNYSFVAPQQLASLQASPVPLSNPLSADLSVMRTSLVPGLLATLGYNLNRQHERVRLFELGVIFPSAEQEAQQVAGVICGPADPEGWASARRPVDFFDIKGDLEALTAGTGATFDYRPSRHAFLHPGQSADIFRDGEAVGWVGALHPNWLKQADLSSKVFGFELSLDAVSRRSVPEFTEISRFPSIRFDLAMEFPAEVRWAEICEIVEENAGNLLTKLVVFDEYTGQGITQGRKSLAFGLVLQDQGATLTDEQAEEVKSNVVANLSDKFGAVLRG